MKISAAFVGALIFVAGLSGLSWWISVLPELAILSISPLIIGVLLGILIANTIGPKIIPDSFHEGISFSTKRILRFAVAFYGFRLTVQEIWMVGQVGLIASVVMLATTLLLGIWFGIKVLKLDRDTSILTSMGAAVCGAAAVLATESLLRAKAHKVAMAVATVVFFGTLAMLLYPFLLRMGWLPLSPQAYGIYVGATIHEVAHAVGAGDGGLAIESKQYAVIVKMTRVLLLAPVLIILGLFLRQLGQAAAGHSKTLIIPWFALGFVLIVLINSLQIIPAAVVALINVIDLFLLIMAMTALGLQTRLSQLAAMGPKPFYLGLVLFLWLSVFGYFLVNALVA